MSDVAPSLENVTSGPLVLTFGRSARVEQQYTVDLPAMTA
jgi:hypothetical protein